MASGLGRRQRASLLNFAAGKLPADTDAGVWFISLHTADPGDDGQTSNEATGTGYARVSVLAATWGVSSVATPNVIASILAVTFPTAGGDWSTAANMTHFGIWNDLTGATEADFVGRGVLDTPAPVISGQTPTFPVGSLEISADETP